MIQLIKGQDKNVIVTLTDITTISNPFYVFVFTHETTKEIVKFCLNSTADLSNFQYRYNEFLFSNTLFNNASIGKYVYSIYESSISTTNIDGLRQIETGKMDFNNAAGFTFPQYNAATNYTQYAG
jgi:hypothetical protein